MVRLCKKTLKRFSPKELKYLKESYEKNPYPHKQTQIQISEHLALSQDRVTKWFVNYRQKLGTARQYFSPKKAKYLKKIYEKNPYPNKQTQIQISEHLAVSQDKVYNWFINRRRKLGLSTTPLFNPKEVKYLKESYEKNPYPNKQTRIEISEHLVVSQNRITRWFQNHRKKLGLGLGKTAGHNSRRTLLSRTNV